MQINRWNHEPDVEPRGDAFLASSSALPGVFGEGETRGEGIENVWEGVEFIGELARQPDWPHDRTPCVDEWETLEDGDGDDDDEPWPWEHDEKWKAD